MTCHACGAQVVATARYCHKCGAHLSSATATGWRAGLPWAVAGAAVGALLTVAGLHFAGVPSTAPLDAPRAADQGGPGGPPMGGGAGRPPDISQMSPEERATRLYNRVMGLHAAGKADSAEFFLPMALQAYSMLPALDIDARYHMGVLQLTGGDAKGALAEADSIRRLSATHLFGFILRAQASELERNTPKAREAYRDFLQNEARERERGLPEYADHAQNLDSFHQRAVEATGGKPNTGT